MKEKSNFLLKMTCFEQIPNGALQSAFLDIVRNLYSITIDAMTRKAMTM